MASLFDQLDRSWTEFTSTPALNGSYPDALALAGGRPGWDDALRWVRAVPGKVSDPVFGCLCRHAHRGDQAAARIVMALLMPGMVGLVNEIRGPSVADREQAVAAAVWERIVRYPTDRRPTQVALNVLWDARRQALRHLEARGPVTIPLDEHGPQTAALAVDERVSVSEELLRLLQERVDDGQLEPALARLIARCRVGDERAVDIARELNVNHRTVTHRRRQAEAVLTAVA